MNTVTVFDFRDPKVAELAKGTVYISDMMGFQDDADSRGNAQFLVSRARDCVICEVHELDDAYKIAQLYIGLRAIGAAAATLAPAPVPAPPVAAHSTVVAPYTAEEVREAAEQLREVRAGVGMWVDMLDNLASFLERIKP